MVLFLSPHLDDVAFSCAGALLHLRSCGERVVVCTVFSHGGRAHAARRREDRAALRSLGVEALHLGFEDAPEREHLAPSFRSLVLDAEPRPALVREVRAAVRAQVERLGPEQLWLPLGVGGHVDHRVVFAAHDAFPAARFYEERPYAFVPALRALRRLELEGGHLARAPSPATLWRQLRRGGCGALLGEGERDDCLAELSRRLRQRHSGAGLRLRGTLQRWSHPRRATALIDAYRSQVHWLLGAPPTEPGAHALWARHATGRDGAWIERAYRPRSWVELNSGSRRARC